MLTEAAATQNSKPILAVLQKIFQHEQQYKLLEIASGSGQHAIYFARQLPNIVFQPSELNPRYLHSIVAHVDRYKLPNVRIPLHIDVGRPPDVWSLPRDFGPGELDALLAVNFIHYATATAVDGLFRAAGVLLNEEGKLITYGPYAFNGLISPQSNVHFDQWLRAQNPEFGLRDVKALEKRAETNGMRLDQCHEMPSNNHLLVFIRK